MSVLHAAASWITADLALCQVHQHRAAVIALGRHHFFDPIGCAFLASCCATSFAGPILPRADEDQVSVWIATTFDPSLGLELAILDVSTPYREVGPSFSACQTVRAGENLYISLVSASAEAKPPIRGRFPKDTLLAYELWFTRSQPPAVTGKFELKQLLKTYADLAYDTVLKPSFYLHVGCGDPLHSGPQLRPGGSDPAS